MTGYYKRIPGFLPLNGYAWDYFGWGGRLEMLFSHAKFIPSVIRLTVRAYRLNRIPGWSYRWPYPWESER